MFDNKYTKEGTKEKTKFYLFVVRISKYKFPNYIDPAVYVRFMSENELLDEVRKERELAKILENRREGEKRKIDLYLSSSPINPSLFNKVERYARDLTKDLENKKISLFEVNRYIKEIETIAETNLIKI